MFYFTEKEKEKELNWSGWFHYNACIQNWRNYNVYVYMCLLWTIGDIKHYIYRIEMMCLQWGSKLYFHKQWWSTISRPPLMSFWPEYKLFSKRKKEINSKIKRESCKQRHRIHATNESRNEENRRGNYSFLVYVILKYFI